MNIKVYHHVADFYHDLPLKLAQAKDRIDLVYFTYMAGPLADQISQILAAKVRAGCRVRLMADVFGTSNENLLKAPQCLAFLANLKKYGIDARFFHQYSGRQTAQHIKYCLIDDQILFIGGSNIADHYVNWEDLNFLIEGPSCQIFAPIGDFVFDQTPLPLLNDNSNAAIKNQDMTVYLSTFNRNSIAESIIDLIHQSHDWLKIHTWYLAPTRQVTQELITAAKRGLKIEIMVSLNSLVPLLNPYRAHLIKKYQQAGIKIHLWPGNYNHKRAYWNEQGQILLGSANIDVISLFFNSEILVGITDQPTAESLSAEYERSKAIIYSSKH